MLPKPFIEQERLLENIRSRQWVKLSPEVEKAYLQTPRHFFLRKFSVDYDHWIEVNEESILNFLPLIYADATLLLWDDGKHISTISQPSLVLHMLELLDVKKGMRVFELGTGSGWNAAMLGRLTGESGEVVSYEIIPELAREAQKTISSMNLPQVKIKEGDAHELLLQEDAFDRGVYTAGAFDLPIILFEKVREGGKLLFVLKTGGDDLLLLLEKRKDHFEEITRLRCRFVPVVSDFSPGSENALPELPEKVMIYPKGHEMEQKAFLRGENCLYVQR